MKDKQIVEAAAEESTQEPQTEETAVKPEAAAAVSGASDELIRAYLKLSDECAALKAELEAIKSLNAELSLKLEAASNAQPDYAAILRDEKFIDGYAACNPELKARIIADYLNGLSEISAVSVLGSGTGATPLTPVAKPKSLAEAKKLAEIIIKG